MERISIVEAARRSGISVEAVIEQIKTGKRRAYGYHDGKGYLKRIPAARFWEPLRVLPRVVFYEDDGSEFPMRGQDDFGRPLYDVDPPTCIDVEESIRRSWG
jgi:hypothetical protein